jgi:protein involved in polysaccharide export with SLBB domain
MLINHLLFTVAIFLGAGMAFAESYSVVGEVQRPGQFPLEQKTTVIQAIAAAGGLKSSASPKSAVIVRGSKDILVNIKKVLDGSAPDFPVLDKDVLRIPKTQPRPVLIAPAKPAQQPDL